MNVLLYKNKIAIVRTVSATKSGILIKFTEFTLLVYSINFVEQTN